MWWRNDNKAITKWIALFCGLLTAQQITVLLQAVHVAKMQAIFSAA